MHASDRKQNFQMRAMARKAAALLLSPIEKLSVRYALHAALLFAHAADRLNAQLCYDAGPHLGEEEETAECDAEEQEEHEEEEEGEEEDKKEGGN